MESDPSGEGTLEKEKEAAVSKTRSILPVHG